MNEPLDIRDPEAAELLLGERGVWILPFINNPKTITQAAKLVGTSESSMRRFAERCVEYGIFTTSRSGRTVQYGLSARHIRVHAPFRQTLESLESQLMPDFKRFLVNNLNPNPDEDERWLHIGVHDEGGGFMGLAGYNGPAKSLSDAPPDQAVNIWAELWLSPSELIDLRARLAALDDHLITLIRHAHEPPRADRRNYLFLMGLVRDRTKDTD